MRQYICQLIQHYGLGAHTEAQFLANTQTYQQHRVTSTQIGEGGSGKVYIVSDPQQQTSNKVFKAWSPNVDDATHIRDSVSEIRTLESLAPDPRFPSPPELCMMLTDTPGEVVVGVMMERIGRHDLYDEINETQSRLPVDMQLTHQSPHALKPLNSAMGKLLTTVESGIDILRGLKDKQIVHGDIKPENMMVDARGCLIPIDFSRACLQGAPKMISTQGYGDSRYLTSPKPCSAEYSDDMFALGISLTQKLESMKHSLLTVSHQLFNTPPAQPWAMYEQLRRAQNPAVTTTLQTMSMAARRHHGPLLNHPFTSEADADSGIRMLNPPGNSPPSSPIPVNEPLLLGSGLCTAAHLQLIQDLEAITKKMRHIFPQYRYTPEEAMIAFQHAKNQYHMASTTTAPVVAP